MKVNYKVLLLLLVVSLCASRLRAQENLVPNPSFEDTLGCPVGYPDLDTKCKFWKSFKGSPDYMNNCSAVCGYNNQFGYQDPHSGKAYAGIAAYLTTIPNLREHIGVQLTNPLIVGTKYYISFYISPGFTLGTNVVCNKMGALVTTNSYSDPNVLSPLINSCTIKDELIIKDTIQWKKISGSFIADSSYQYLVIGNFFDDNNVDTMHLPDLGVGYFNGYYYIDDICLSTDSVYAETWTGIEDDKAFQYDFEIYPNPTSAEINIRYNQLIQQLELFNLLGEIVIIKTEINVFTTILNLEDLPNNIYFLRIKNKKGDYKTKIILKN